MKTGAGSAELAGMAKNSPEEFTARFEAQMAARRATLEDVAKVYREAQLAGEPPHKAVMAHFKIGHSTAGTRIREARLIGVLGLDVHVRQPKIAAVAEALGVTYEDLVEAVRVHANGDLRVYPWGSRRKPN